MKEISVVVIFGLAIIFATGCAHKHAFSEQEVRQDFPDGIIVELESANVSAGDRVDLVRESCRSEMPVRGTLKCKVKRIGEAVVVSLVDTQHAVIQTLDGTVYEKGLKIRKSR